MKFSLLVVSTIAAVILVGCASGQGGMFGPGNFEVIEADTRFSASKDAIFTSKNNRVSSKSIAGGTHIDGTGVFINPIMIKSTAGDVLSLGFSIENMASHDTTFGSPNTLGTIQSITFLINNGAPLVINVISSSTEWSDVISYNSVTRSASSNIIESGIAGLSKEDYANILSAQELAIRIQGSRRSVVYENSDVSRSFIPNLREFYSNYVLANES